MKAQILAIGTELAIGQAVDTNSAWLAQQLAAMGIHTSRHVTVTDNLADITDAIRDAAANAELVLISGGLGPTADDLTRDALADAMGVNLAIDEPSVTAIRAMMEKRGRVMPERNKVQAMHPRGSVMIRRPLSTPASSKR